VRIIDDDDVGHLEETQIDESELYATNEEAPQIVGVIDERAPDVILKQEYQQSGKWKILGNADNDKLATFKIPQAPRSESPTDRVRGKRKESPDASPPRKRKGSDESPPRRTRRDSDASPPRRNAESNGSRSRDYTKEATPPRRTIKQERRGSDDNSPPRRQSKRSPERTGSRRRHSEDNSPPRRTQPREIKRERRDSDSSPPRKSQFFGAKRQSRSPPPPSRRSRWSPDVKREPESPRNRRDSPPRSSKMTKTLDGKHSGLQNAKNLRNENQEFRQNQERMFSQMSEEASGRHAEVVIRDRRGRNKEFEMGLEEERRKAEAEAERKKEYDRWGKGLKQVEELEQRYQEHMHEASKPFARAADDEDLRDHLRQQERLDDPMLEYMRKKKRDDNVKKGVLEKPAYIGTYPDNRFNIKPGYRWDGVDRSNGYEKKFFMMHASKKSIEEEAYRYSTEDM